MGRSKGFSLIELLISITIFGILVGIGMASYNEFNKTQTLKQAALNLKNDLRVAQNKALSGEKTTCAQLDGYRVTFSNPQPDQGQYVLAAACAGGSSVNVDSVLLPKNIFFNPLPSSLLFKVLGQGVQTARTICVSGFTKIYKLSVTVSGETLDEGVVSACP